MSISGRYLSIMYPEEPQHAQLIDGDFARFDPEAGRLTTVIERKRVGDDDIVGAWRL